MGENETRTNIKSFSGVTTLDPVVKAACGLARLIYIHTILSVVV
jgi:hypothetical protein